MGIDTEAGPVVILTGAARGIGRATADAFARSGYRLVLADRDGVELERAVVSLTNDGAAVESHVGDLADLEFARSIVDATAGEFGQIDVLVNNAAVHDSSTMQTVDPAAWDAILRVNLTSPAFLARWSAEVMCKHERGAIINIASIEGFQPKSLCPAYIAAKAGLRGLTWNLAALYGPQGLRVVCVSPGAIDTELSRDYVTPTGENVSELLRTDTEDRIPLRRWGQPQEIAQAVLWLASDQATYVTGTELVIDGGWTRHLGRYSITDQLLPESANRGKNDSGG